MKQITLILLLLSSLSHAAGPSIEIETDEVVPAAQRCSNALDACIDLQKDLTGEVQLLKTEVQGLETAIKKDEDHPLPWWVYVIGGGLVGYGAAKTFGH